MVIESLQKARRRSVIPKGKGHASLPRFFCGTEVRKTSVPIAVFILLTLLFPFRMFPAHQNTQDQNEELKAQIIIELHQAVKEIVRTELENYSVYRVPDLVAKDRAQQTVSKESAGTKVPVSGKRDFRTVLSDRKIRELTNLEFASYRAGGTESETQIAPGMAKKSNPSGNQQLGYSDVQKEYMQQIAQEESYSRPRQQRSNAVERMLIEEGGLLLPRGTLQVEPTFTAAHFSSNKINIEGFSILPVLVIGEISTESVKRDILIGSMPLRYGIWHNIQGEVKVPYRYEFDRITSNLGDEKTKDVRGLGDIEATLSAHVLRENGIIPDTIVSLGVKSPTGSNPYLNPIGLGTGHWGVRAGVVGVKTSDPAVVFGTLNYTWNLPETYSVFGEMDPGDSVGFGFGTAIALSYQTAINFQYEQSITSKLKRSGIPVNGSYLNSAALKAGFSWTHSEKAAIDFSLGMGLTTDAPDYIVELRFPYKF
ncbi:MAG: transporter [Candidatus Omnitrophica bacterium]|nr:transporter [Candidatus Omnitrophota bacterium]